MFKPDGAESARLLLETRGLKTVYPLDEAIGVAGLPFRVTADMMLDIARRAVNSHSYKELQRAYKRDFDIDVSDDEIRRVTNWVGQAVWEDDLRRRDAALGHLGEGDHASLGTREGVLYVEMDGAMLNTRAESAGSTWREHKLGLVFREEDLVTYTNSDGKERRRIGRREYVSLIGPADEFLPLLYSAALANGLEECERVVSIGDGAKWIKRFGTEYCAGLDFVQILDFAHLKENVYKFATAFVRGKNKRAAFAAEVCDLLHGGKVDEALERVEPYRDKRRDGIPNLYSYIESNRDGVDYPAYEAAGYFIGSGAIESGNRSVVQERAKLPGMRWNLETVQYVLAAKTKEDSGLWETRVVPVVYRKLGLER